MSKNNIKKNIKLSGEFDRYISRNPSVLKRIPRGVNIVMTSSKDQALSTANRNIARNNRSGQFIEAHKADGSWKIQSIQR